MALIQAREIYSENNGTTRYKVVQWDNVTENDTCSAYKVAGWADKSVQVSGTFSTISIAIQGANHPGAGVAKAKQLAGDTAIPGDSSYVTLTDASDNALTFTAAACEIILQNTFYIKPSVSSGSSSDVDIVMFLQDRVR